MTINDLTLAVRKRSGADAYLRTCCGDDGIREADAILARALEPVPSILASMAKQDDNCIILSTTGALNAAAVRYASRKMDRDTLIGLCRALWAISASTEIPVITITDGVSVAADDLACAWNKEHQDAEPVSYLMLCPTPFGQ